MTAVDGSTRTDEAVLESLDFEVPCQIQTQSMMRIGRAFLPVDAPTQHCEKAAVWVMRCRACSAPTDACDEHARMVLAQRLALCGRCKAHAPGIVLFEALPMPGGAS